MNKVCNTCKVEQEVTAFRIGSAKCRKCAYAKKLEWQKKNPDKMIAQGRRQYARHKVKMLAQMRRHRLEHKEEISARHKAARKNPASAAYQARFGSGRKKYLEQKRSYNAKAKSVRQRYARQRWNTDISYRLKRALCRHLRDAIKGESKSKKVEPLLGCPIESFRMYLESKFEPGMSWENYGKKGWEIDHIMPMAIFSLDKPEHQRRAFHFSNMQPMWSSKNRAKGAKVLTNQFTLI